MENRDNSLLLEYQKKSKFSLKDKIAFVLDLDGTVYVGNQAIESSIEFINKNSSKFRFYFMTNNTSNSKQVIINKLTKMGLKIINKDDIITPIDTLKIYLQKNSISKVYCVATNPFIEELKASDIEVLNYEEKEDIETLVLAYDTTIDYKKISEFGLLLEKDIPYLATHNDLVCPSERGFIPDVGSFIEMFKASNGRIPEKIFGKPNLDLLQPILKKYNKSEVVVVGDRLYTDKILAENCSVDFALVLTGETKIEELSGLDKMPSIVLSNLKEIEGF